MIRAVITEYNGSRILALKESDSSAFLSFKLYTGRNREGYIYNGRVDKRISNIDACFVRLSKEEYGYLDTSGIRPETTIPVMIKKEGKGEKKASLSTELSVSGRYCVLICNRKGAKAFYSHKLSLKKRKELSKSLSESGYEFRYSLIFRTNSGQVPFSDVYDEIAALVKDMDQVVNYNDKRTDYSILYRPADELIRDLYDIGLNELDEIITDLKDAYELVKEGYIKDLPQQFKEKIRLTLYEDELLPLKSLVGLETGLSRAVDKKVWLKSGSYLVIEQTEALVAIDVNSGKNEAKGIKAETVYRINREAAVEAARQLRLRNLSGIVIIDFINMKKKEHEEGLMELLREEIAKDSVRTELIDMTKLGLAELTRKREGLTLREMLYDADPCSR
ncbi:MAG: ribonuclease E/G [Lachnospiraceae bacterium]|nr:ribonuclease E/G [Lachnospiraceae bacterium]